MTTADAMIASPPRVRVINLDLGFGITAQYNPDTLTTELEAAYDELEILGVGHHPMQYKGTGNRKNTFELSFDSTSTRPVELFGSAPPGLVQAGPVDLARRFLESLCVPLEGATNVATGAPPRVLFFWPRTIRIEGRVRKVTIAHKRFFSDMSSALMVATIEMSEQLKAATCEGFLAEPVAGAEV